MGAIKMPSGKSLPAGKLDKFKACNWQGRRWSWVDPLKDINAHKEAVALSVKSRRDICTEMGLDFEDVIAQIEQENQLLAVKGIAAAVKPAAVAAESKPEETSDERPEA